MVFSHYSMFDRIFDIYRPGLQVDQDVHQINGKDSEGVFTRVGHADVSADSDAECEKSLAEMEF